MSDVKLTFLGTGTSQGIPIIGCQCAVCRSADPHDKRFRAAAFVAANKGLPERVLWASSVKDGMMSGYTGNYIRVEKPYDPALVNTLEDIVI